MMVIAALLLVALPMRLDATTIVALRTPERVILASDSLVIVTSSAGAETTAQLCKLRRAGPWAFVVGGFIGLADRDVFSLVARAITPTRTIADAVRAIRDQVQAELHDPLKRAFHDPAFTGFTMLTVIVGGMDGETPAVGMYTAELQSRAPFTLTISGATCPGAWCPDGVVVTTFSIAEGPATQFIRARPRPAWLDRGDAAAARRLIALQVADTPMKVGGPIDVVQIDRQGARWIGRETTSLCVE
jgi:hypothetical protein